MSNTAMGVTQIPKSIEELLDFKDFMPEFTYQVDGLKPSEKSQEMIQGHQSFLHENYELILGQALNRGIPVDQVDRYLKGFKDAIAITELWLTSLNLDEDITK